MKKYKLKRWVKVIITAIVVVIGVLIYSGLKVLGSDATTNQISSVLCILGWSYLAFGQFLLLSGLWEK